jgi:hypothetical protein
MIIFFGYTTLNEDENEAWKLTENAFVMYV